MEVSITIYLYLEGYKSLMNKSLLLKTDSGNLIYPPNQIIAVASRGPITQYRFVDELDIGDVVYMSRTIADLDLNKHIKPTLWVTSDLYRKDWSIIYNGTPIGEHRTKLSCYLEPLVNISNNEHKNAIDLIYNILYTDSRLAGLTYHRSTIKSWFDNKTMFPLKPLVLEVISEHFQMLDLYVWSKSLAENPESIRRIRAVHSGIMNAIATPENNKDRPLADYNVETDRLNNGNAKIANIKELMQLIRSHYDKEFSEFVEPVKIVSITPIETESATRIEDNNNHLESQTPKRIIGYSSSDVEKKSIILNAYSGIGREEEISRAMLERKNIFIEMIPMLGDLAFKFFDEKIETIKKWSSINGCKFYNIDPQILPLEECNLIAKRSMDILLMEYGTGREIGPNHYAPWVRIGNDNKYFELFFKFIQHTSRNGLDYDELKTLGIKVYNSDISFMRKVYNSSILLQNAISCDDFIMYYSVFNFDSLFGFDENAKTTTTGQLRTILKNATAHMIFTDRFVRELYIKMKRSMDDSRLLERLDKTSSLIPDALKILHVAVLQNYAEELTQRMYGLGPEHFFTRDFIMEIGKIYKKQSSLKEIKFILLKNKLQTTQINTNYEQ